MRADLWEGIVALVILAPVGIACLVGAALGPRRARVGRVGVVSMSLAGVGFLVIGVGLFVALALDGGTHHVTFTVARTVEVDTRSGQLPPEYFVVTTHQRWYAVSHGQFGVLRDNVTYTCSIDDEHYSGTPTPLRAQTSLHTCVAGAGGS